MAKSKVDAIDELRSRVAALEEDNEYLMDIVRDMSKLFGAKFSVDDGKMDIPHKKTNPIINRIGRGDTISVAQVELIQKYADESMYAEADWFRKQIVTAFEKIYLRINKSLPKKPFTFAEVMQHITAVTVFDDKLEVQLYIKNLNTGKAAK